MKKNTAQAALAALRASKLSAGAKRIYQDLSDKKIESLFDVLPMDFEEVSERIMRMPGSPKRLEVISGILGMQRRGADEGQFIRLYGIIIAKDSDYEKAWLKGARDFARAVIEAEGAGAVESQTDKNVEGVHSHAELMGYGLQKLKDTGHLPSIFRHGTELARVALVKEENAASVTILSRDAFAAVLPLVGVDYRRQRTETTTIGIAPPQNVIRDLYHHPELPLPYLAGITRIPTFASDGTLITASGYSSLTYNYYVPSVGLEIPPVTTGIWKKDDEARKRDVSEAAKFLITEVFGDYPFDGKSRQDIEEALEKGEPMPASLCNALGLLIEPFVRPMIKGPCPAVLVSKPSPSTGATFLIEAIQLIISGQSKARPPLSSSEEERRKVLFTAVKGGESLLLFDNQKATVDSPTLASLLTSTTFTDRELGRSEERALPVRSTVVFTSNNALFSEELQRRLSLIRLDAKMPNPKERSDWRHDQFHTWVEDNRGKLIWCVLTIVASWVAQGRKGPVHCPSVPSYSDWRRVVGGIIESIGPSFTTFQGNRHEIEIYAAANEEEGIVELLNLWRTRNRDLSAKDLAVLAEDADVELEGIKTTRDGAYSPRSLSGMLSSMRGRHFVLGEEVFVLEDAGEVAHTLQWRLRKVDRPEAPSGAQAASTDRPGRRKHVPRQSPSAPLSDGENRRQPGSETAVIGRSRRLRRGAKAA
ncbi:hypothetical protein SAMN04488020_105154 [Palleronia marisminoris]|uniref:Uncharacterized protein n=1 Tax=Palleronia marisminoris TaxID=315423 RepID=A0A1Y5SSJ0_9RHOB|nr:hypothetical protein [Palleronia marisminoris]SFG96647.1 hypothetical protein SAMN04488020_105154 [Palleronia marisminoris]SLN47426.1 hypothetical protein PAM7066_02098 [Palleronia marisminoris]